MPPTYRIFGWFFPRALAGIYFIAFGSWWLQCDALTGKDGIMPTPRFLEAAEKFAAQEGFIAWLRWPSLFWWHFSDAFARGLCLAGCVLALLVMAGVLQGPLLLLLWAGYLSIATTSDVFMNYQWDALLLETGFMAVLISPWRLFVGRIKAATPLPSRVQMLLPQALAVKLMFLSGVVKLASGDRTWHDLTALQFHYETQPIPTWTSWWVHQLPTWLHTGSCALMFFIELVMPVVFVAALLLEAVAPSCMRIARALKLLTAASFTMLMLLVVATGNYTFFNWLTILISLSALDDACWTALAKRWPGWPGEPPQRAWWLQSLQTVPVGIMLALSTLVTLQRLVFKGTNVTDGLDAVLKHITPFLSVNTYGLFAVMTTERHEIVIEVSEDGVFFQPLEFKWKPGAVQRAPAFVAPHQPRLDWQMWFAALHPGFDPRRDMRGGSMVWFGELLAAILNHNEKVLALMEPPPIPVDKIQSVRAQFYRYRFTDWKTRKATGDWWTREFVGAYSPKFTRHGA